MGVQDRLIELEKVIREARADYYQNETAMMTDAMYDALVSELGYIYSRLPSMRPENSVLNTLGDQNLKFLEPVEHKPKIQLVSHNVFCEKAVTDIYTRMCELAKKPVEMMLLPSVVGVSAVLRYEKGILVTAALLGDGVYGENIMRHVTHMPQVPKRLLSFLRDIPVITIHGVITISADRYESLLNSGRNYKTLRKAVIMMLRAHNSDETPPSHFEFIPHGLACESSDYRDELRKMNIALDYLKDCGFTRCDSPTVVTDVREAISVSNTIFSWTAMKSCHYQYDGVLYVPNSCELYATMLNGPENGALILRQPTDTKMTRVQSITASPDRHGYIRLTVNVDPMNDNQLGAITAITLPSAKRLLELDLRVGDTIRVKVVNEKRGMIESVVMEHRDENTSSEYEPIEVCPSCNSPVIANGGIYEKCECSQYTTCPGVNNKRIEYWCKSAIGLHTADMPLIRQLLETTIVTSIFSLYTFNLDAAADALAEYGYVRDRIQATCRVFSQVTNIPQVTALHSLSIPGVGPELAPCILTRYPDITTFSNPGLWAEFDDSIPHWSHAVDVAVRKFRGTKPCVDEIYRLTTPAPVNGLQEYGELVTIVNSKNTLFNGSLLKGITVGVHPDLYSDSLEREIVDNGGVIHRNWRGKKPNLTLAPRNPRCVKGEPVAWNYDESEKRYRLTIAIDGWDDLSWKVNFTGAMTLNYICGPEHG